MFLQKYQVVAYEEVCCAQEFCIKSPAALLGSMSLGEASPWESLTVCVHKGAWLPDDAILLEEGAAPGCLFSERARVTDRSHHFTAVQLC